MSIQLVFSVTNISVEDFVVNNAACVPTIASMVDLPSGVVVVDGHRFNYAEDGSVRVYVKARSPRHRL